MADLMPEALADQLEKLAAVALKAADDYESLGSQRNTGYWRGRHDAYTACATEVRDRLAPAHAALTAERDAARIAERERIQGLFGEWITIAMSEPNSHPPEAWKIAFADLISDKPQFPLAAREALEGGHG